MGQSFVNISAKLCVYTNMIDGPNPNHDFFPNLAQSHHKTVLFSKSVISNSFGRHKQTMSSRQHRRQGVGSDYAEMCHGQLTYFVVRFGGLAFVYFE